MLCVIRVCTEERENSRIIDYHVLKLFGAVIANGVPVYRYSTKMWSWPVNTSGLIKMWCNFKFKEVKLEQLLIHIHIKTSCLPLPYSCAWQHVNYEQVEHCQD